jgi:hypothetical protein
VANDIVISTVATADGTVTCTPGANETEWYEGNSGSSTNPFGCGQYEVATGTSTTIAPTLSASTGWHMRNIRFRPLQATTNQALVERMRIAPNGNVGIGIMDPQYKLAINGDLFIRSGSTVGWRIFSRDDAATTNGCDAGGGTGSMICIDSDNDPGTSEWRLSTAGNVFAEGTISGGQDPDVAEQIPVNDASIEPADILSADDPSLIRDENIFNRVVARKSYTAYDSKVIGIVSANPSLLAGGSNELNDTNIVINGNKRAMAIAGRVKTKVATLNGSIKTGDAITTSTIPGFGMKATRAGTIVGKALQDFDGSNNTIPCPVDTNARCGIIIVLVNISWYDPDVYIANSGDLNITDNSGDFKAWVAGQSIERKAAYADAVIARLTAGIVKTKQLIVEGTATFLGSVQMQTLNVANTLQAASIEVVNNLKAGTISATSIAVNNLSIAGQNLRDYILAVVEQAGFSKNQNHITSPIAEIDRIHTNIISPLASDSAILVNGKLVILSEVRDPNRISPDSQNDTALEVQGSASISGNLSVSDASVAGTLRAGKIIADQIEGLDAHIASLTANTITATNAAISTSANTSGSGILASGSANLASLISSSIVSDYASVASFTANLAFVPNLNAQFGTFEQGLMAFGPSSLSDVSVAGQLSINGSMIFTDNSINTLGANLQIQPLRQGNISFMAGLVTIDIDGNISVAGNATFAKNVRVNGTLAAKVISPVPDEDLIIKLPGSSYDTQLAVDRPSIIVQNASDSAVLRITDEGDILASGEANFKHISTNSFKIIRGAQADTSLTQTIATASAGTATIKAGQFERTIISPFVSDKSLIYITPVTNTNGVTPYIARQTAEDAKNGIKGSFTIRIPVLQTSDVKVNWWIVN